MGVVRPEMQVALPSANRIGNEHSRYILIGVYDRAMTRRNVHRVSVAQSLQSHDTLADIQDGRGQAHIDLELRAQHLKQGGPGMDQHRVSSRLRPDIAYEFAGLQMQLLLAEIGGVDRLAGARDLAAGSSWWRSP